MMSAALPMEVSALTVLTDEDCTCTNGCIPEQVRKEFGKNIKDGC
jgi:hypothetical protein